jgi:hypothetical protein
MCGPYIPHRLIHLFHLNLIILKVSGKEYLLIMNLLIMQRSLPVCYFVSLKFKQSLHHFLLKYF